VEFEIGDGAGWRADVFPVHAANDTDERSGSGKDVFNFGFLIGNFWPVPLNKTHIVGTSIQAQLPEPSCIKDLIGWGFLPVRPFLVKMFHAWVFRQLRHECSPCPNWAAACKASAATGS
jgi:hypothetical protein